jgi:hypothetical protein
MMRSIMWGVALLVDHELMNSARLGPDIDEELLQALDASFGKVVMPSLVPSWK